MKGLLLKFIFSHDYENIQVFRRPANMNPRKLLLLTFIVLLLTTPTFAQSGMFLDHVDGLYGTSNDTLDVNADSIIFHIRMTNQLGVPTKGWTNGFRVYSNNGAEWTVPANDTIGYYTGTILPSMAEQSFVNQFSVTGEGADTVGFGGFSLFAPGIPNGFEEIVWTINIGPILPIYHRKEICLDSSYYPPAGAWKWNSGGTDMVPDWDGPHCFTIFDVAQNIPAVLDPIGDKAIGECGLLEFTVTGSNPLEPSTPPILTAENIPAGATFDDHEDGTATFSWTPDVNANASSPYSVTFKAEELGGEDTETISITVIDNQAPTIAAIAPITVKECLPVDFTLDGSDPEGLDLIYSVDVNLPGATLDANSGAYSWTPVDGDNGVHNLTFTATDPCGATFDLPVTITVNDNIAPSFTTTPGPFNNNEGDLIEFTLEATDTEGQAIVFSTVDPDMPGTATLDGVSGAFSWSPLAGAAALSPYIIDFIVTDACGLTDVITVTINLASDAAPVFTPIDPKFVDACNSVEFTVIAVDPETTSVIYSLSNLPDGASFNTTTGDFAWVPTTHDDGFYTLNFTATDEVGTQATLDVDLTVNPDGIPEFLDVFEGGVNDTTVVACNPVVFTVSATDPEGSPVGIFWEDELPEGAIFDPVIKEFSWTPTAAQGGAVYTIKFRSKDDCLTIGSRDVVITVNSNPVPIFTAQGPKFATECKDEISFTVSASDPDGTDVTLSLLNKDEMPGSDFKEDVFTWAPNLDTNITNYTALFEAVDACGATDTQEVNITITLDAKPELDQVDDITVSACDVVSFEIITSDTIKFYNDALPGSAVISEKNGIFEWTPTADEAGVYLLKFYGIDNGCGTVSDTLEVNVEVLANTPPVFLEPIIDTVINLNLIDSISFILNAIDADGFRISYLSTPLPDSAQLLDIENNNNDSGSFIWLTEFVPTGTYEITFYVEDICGVMDSTKLMFDIITGITTDQTAGIPDAYFLTQNYPNPFNPTTQIQFGLSKSSYVTLEVFNVLGQKIKTLADGQMSPNSYIVEWNGTNDNGAKVASGIYMYKLITDDYTETKKMMMLK